MRRSSILLGAFALGGCLEVPTGPPQECHVASDCDSGEVCTEGLCYGAPPQGMFAATLTAPAAREEVIATEIADLMLPADGWLGDLPLEVPVTISGRVEAYGSTSATSCNTASVGAEVRFTRPARFPGGPTLRLTTQSKPGVQRGTDSFSIRVPRTREGDPPWTVTIDPDGGGAEPPTDGGSGPAELVPPRHLNIYAADNLEHQTYILGSADAPVITGSLKDALGQSLLGYRVVALGRWESGAAQTEVSTIDFTTDGSYSITVAEEALGPLELVITPYGENNVGASLHLTYVTDATHARNITQPTGLGQPTEIDIPIEGLAGNGEVKPVAGARVIVHAVLEPQFSGGARVVLDAEATTGEDGIAHLSVLDGELLTAAYRLRVVPPASSPLGVVFDGPIALDKIVPVRLPSRVALSGKVIDAFGVPQPSVAVTARRSLRFLWSVAAEDQTFLDEIPASTALTPESGEFVVWVDPAVAGVWGHYDLFFETPAGSFVPNWSIGDLEIPRMAGTFTVPLDTVTLPDSARVHGRIVDSNGLAVEGSALRVFQLISNEPICREVSFEPQDCAPGTSVLGSAESDDKGVVRLGLPRF
jgi:hypothetical protein